MPRLSRVPGPQTIYDPQPARPLVLARYLTYIPLFLLTLVALTLLVAGFCYVYARLTGMPSTNQMAGSEAQQEKAEKPEGDQLKVSWPWTEPPKPLPGPYDIRLFPPMSVEKIRRDSSLEPTSNSASFAKTSSSNYSKQIPTKLADSSEETLGVETMNLGDGPDSGRRRIYRIVPSA